MSSQELKKKEKGKEAITIEENPSISMYCSAAKKEKSDQILLDPKPEIFLPFRTGPESKRDMKIGNEEKKRPSSKIKPIFYTSDEKARLRWSSDLHECFLNAVAKLGGPHKATPKGVKEIMEVEGIALHHVKSHLQKFRLGKCNKRDGTDKYNRRIKAARNITKAYASSNSPRSQVNIRPKPARAVKSKKAKELPGSLYMIIEQGLHLQRCREAERMQMTYTIENQRNMLKAQHLKTCSMYEPPHMYTSAIHSTQRKLQFNDNYKYNTTQGFINSYMPIEPQSMHGSSTFTTHRQLQLNGDCFIYDTYHNASLVSAMGTSNNTIQFLAMPQSRQESNPHHIYNPYPPYNTLEVVKTQLQNSSIGQIQDTTSRETNLRSITEDELDPVDKYIDWGKVEEMDIELDPVEILEALGFGVSS